jgi:uncharacterized protein (TIGR02266 family)
MSTKILLPDDAVVKDIMENSFFHRDGFEFIEAAPADQLFLQIEEQDPALVVLDVETSGIDTAGLCDMIKNDAILEKTKIILIVPSESRRRDDAYSCIDADAIVGRPIDQQRFLTSASHLLGIFNRADPRIETFLMVSCGSDIDELHQGWIRNVNSGGAFIETKELLPVDYRMQIQFELDEGTDLISCTARVAWVNHPEWIKCEKLPPGMGIQFIDLAEEDEKQIVDFIEAQLVNPPGP